MVRIGKFSFECLRISGMILLKLHLMGLFLFRFPTTWPFCPSLWSQDPSRILLLCLALLFIILREDRMLLLRQSMLGSLNPQGRPGPGRAQTVRAVGESPMGCPPGTQTLVPEDVSCLHPCKTGILSHFLQASRLCLPDLFLCLSNLSHRR